jgi:hypothetical protein
MLAEEPLIIASPIRLINICFWEAGLGRTHAVAILKKHA